MSLSDTVASLLAGRVSATHEQGGPVPAGHPVIRTDAGPAPLVPQAARTSS